jgi:hypothetical protein
MKTYAGTRIIIGFMQIIGWLICILGSMFAFSEHNAALFIGGLVTALFLHGMGGIGMAVLDLVEHTLNTRTMPPTAPERSASPRQIQPAAELLEPEEPRRTLDHTDIARLEREAAARNRGMKS